MGAATISDEFIVMADAKADSITFAKSASADLEKSLHSLNLKDAMASVSSSAQVRDTSERTHLI